MCVWTNSDFTKIGNLLYFFSFKTTDCPSFGPNPISLMLPRSRHFTSTHRAQNSVESGWVNPLTIAKQPDHTLPSISDIDLCNLSGRLLTSNVSQIREMKNCSWGSIVSRLYIHIQLLNVTPHPTHARAGRLHTTYQVVGNRLSPRNRIFLHNDSADCKWLFGTARLTENINDSEV